MRNLKSIVDFQNENQAEISSLEMTSLFGGVNVYLGADCCTEKNTTQCPDGQGTDSEEWIYDDSNGRRAIKGTIDGVQVYP